MTEMKPKRPDLPQLDLRVERAWDLHETLRRVQFSCVGGLPAYWPGQDLVLLLPLGDGTTGRRHYTIRSLTTDGHVLVDFVLHCDTPGPAFARTCRPGDIIAARGPRGRTRLREAETHLFVGDDTSLPAILHMIETAPPGASGHAIVETGASYGNMDSGHAGFTLHLLHRSGPARPSDLQLDALRTIPVAEFEMFYLLGETGGVRAMRHHLAEQGVPKDRILSEGYWRPGREGGHDHV